MRFLSKLLMFVFYLAVLAALAWFIGQVGIKTLNQSLNGAVVTAYGITATVPDPTRAQDLLFGLIEVFIGIVLPLFLVIQWVAVQLHNAAGTKSVIRPSGIPLPTNRPRIDDPFETVDSKNHQMLNRAAALIRAGRYEEARATLQSISSDPKAREWLFRLQGPEYKQ